MRRQLLCFALQTSLSSPAFRSRLVTVRKYLPGLQLETMAREAKSLQHALAAREQVPYAICCVA
jgi:hypothetical protein